MRITLRSAVLLCLPFATMAQPAPTQSLHGHVPAALAGLAPAGRLEADRVLPLAIGLPLRHQDELTGLLQRIYDPASPDYHHYLTPAQFAEKFGPTEQDYQALTAFANAHGLKVTATHPNRALLDVTGPVSNIEKAFHVTLRTYQHPRENRVFFAPDGEPSLDLAAPVLHIGGLDNYLQPHPMSLRKKPLSGASGVAPASGSGPDGAYMGNDFRAAYTPGLALTGTGQSVGLLEFDGYFPNDITLYTGLTGLTPVQLKNVYLDGFDGTPGMNNVEVALDIDMAMSMAPGLSSIIVYEGELTDSVLNRMATDGLANQLSASWTYPIDDVSEQIFLQYAAQGQSFFNASGDSDAYVGLVPTPSDDPNITCVGGTTLTTAAGGAYVSETVWNWDVEFGPQYDGEGSSGGISTAYSIPAWQLGVSMTANGGSTIMRNIPDVALTADNVFVVADDGQNYNVGGTSCATPLWAAYLSLVNQQAVSSGSPPLGFLNPTIYALGLGPNYAGCFHDITTGNNTWSASQTLFYAVPGYDLCTGWGTPKGSNLVNVLAPPDPLQISPLGGLAATGGVGGPLTPSSLSYTLTNGGNATLNWSAGASVPWLNVSLPGGTLTPGGTVATVTVSLNAASSNLFLGTYGATLWFTNLTDGSVQTRPVSLTIIKPPVITTQPTNLTLIAGTTATFSATAAGGLPLNCQWQFNGANLTNGGKISGAQASLAAGGNIYGSISTTLTISNVASGDGGTYTLLASNAAGVVVSSNALLTVTLSAPVILQQPASQAVLVGATVQMSVVAVGTTPLSYQWQQNGTNLTDGGSLSGSATPDLTINGVSSANIGSYTVVVTNVINLTTSSVAVLTVQVAQPGTQLVLNGGFETGNFSSWAETGNFTDCTVSRSTPAVFSGHYGALLGPAGSLGGLSQSLPTVAGQTYFISLWLDSPDGISPNEFLAAWNGSALFDQTNLAAIGWTNLQFNVTATGTNTVLQFGFRDDDSFLGLDNIQVIPLVSANGAPIIVTQPASLVGEVANTAAFSVLSAGRLPLFYQWQFDGTNLNNATDATLALSNLTTNQSGTYDVVVSNTLGRVTSSNALLNVVVGAPALITFDDLPGTDVPVPAGYNNLTWSNFYYLNALNNSPPSGYVAGMISPPNVAYNAYGAPAAISSTVPFDLLSAYLTAAWDDNLQVEFIGYNGATPAYDATYTLSATVPKLVTFNYLGVTAVQIISSGGTPHIGYSGGGENFVMDNVSVIFPPNPPVITLQPTNETVLTGSSVTFSVAASGSPPLYYFWSRDGAPIAGANSSSYTTNNVQVANSGTQFSCLVSNAYGSMPSSTAVLTVINPPGSSVLAQGNLVVTITNYGGRISSVLFKGIELYQVGYYVSDWGLQTGTNADTFVHNEANFGNIGQPMTLVTSNAHSAFYTGTYTAGGANVALSRSYQLVPGFDVLATTQTFTNNGASPITLRCFDTFDPDWSNNLVQYYYDYAHRYTLSYDAVSLQVGRATMTNDGTTIILGTADGAAVLAASDPNYFGILVSSNLNTFFASDGADSGGAAVDLTLDIGREMTLLPGSGASFVFFQSIGSTVSNAETAVEDVATGNTNIPPVITTQPASQTVSVGASATFSVSASGPPPLSYFWRRNSVPIAGATASSYTTNNVQLADSGALFNCLVSNAFGTATSTTATLTVMVGSLVLNGGFETGTFADWTSPGGFAGCFIGDPPFAHSGLWGAELGPVGLPLGTISQTIPTTAGQPYLISCWLYSGDGATPNEFAVYWGSTTLFDQVNIGAIGWTNLQFQANATAASTALTFGFRDDPSFLGLDDIAVYLVAIPAPQIQSVSYGNGAITFSWSMQPGHHYQMQTSTNLSGNHWVNFGAVMTAVGSSMDESDTITAFQARFYRIVQLP